MDTQDIQQKIDVVEEQNFHRKEALRDYPHRCYYSYTAGQILAT